MFTRNSAHSYNIIQTQEDILSIFWGLMLSIGTQKRIISKGISGTYKLYNIGFKKCTQIFGKQAIFLVNKFDAELPIGTRNGIYEKCNYLYINELCF